MAVSVLYPSIAFIKGRVQRKLFYPPGKLFHLDTDVAAAAGAAAEAAAGASAGAAVASAAASAVCISSRAAPAP